MYTIISGTNREDSHTEKVAREYQRLLGTLHVESQIFTLKGLDISERSAAFKEAEEKYLIPSQKFIFILPEYNGSYPGVVKTVIDISDVKQAWWWKKALLTGVSTGRAGNLRGMDHITGSLNHMKVIVHPNKLPLSAIDTLLDKTGAFHHQGTLQAVEQQLKEFINF